MLSPTRSSGKYRLGNGDTARPLKHNKTRMQYVLGFPPSFLIDRTAYGRSGQFFSEDWDCTSMRQCDPSSRHLIGTISGPRLPGLRGFRWWAPGSQWEGVGY